MFQDQTNTLEHEIEGDFLLVQEEFISVVRDKNCIAQYKNWFCWYEKYYQEEE